MVGLIFTTGAGEYFLTLFDTYGAMGLTLIALIEIMSVMYIYGHAQFTDDIEEIYKWKFPEITINPNEYLLLWCSGKDIRNVSTFRTLVNQGDIFKYTVPYEQPDPSWNTLAFDDEDWLSGASGFGYDDGDDATFIPQGTTSALVRRKFNINDVTSIERVYVCQYLH